MTPPKDVLLYHILGLQPSQLWISQEKLATVLSQLDFSNPLNIPPVPVKIMDGHMMLTDGHTRTFAAYKRDLAFVPIYFDQDELDWEAYRICLQWCREEGITSVADLENRVVTPKLYEKVWLQRCHKMHTDLANKRKHSPK